MNPSLMHNNINTKFKEIELKTYTTKLIKVDMCQGIHEDNIYIYSHLKYLYCNVLVCLSVY